MVYLPCYRPYYLDSLTSSFQKECVQLVNQFFQHSQSPVCCLATILTASQLHLSLLDHVYESLRVLRPECGITVSKEADEYQVKFDRNQ